MEIYKSKYSFEPGQKVTGADYPFKRGQKAVIDNPKSRFHGQTLTIDSELMSHARAKKETGNPLVYECVWEDGERHAASVAFLVHKEELNPTGALR